MKDPDNVKDNKIVDPTSKDFGDIILNFPWNLRSR